MNNLQKNPALRTLPLWMLPFVACLFMLFTPAASIAQPPNPPCGPCALIPATPWVYHTQLMYISTHCAAITVNWRTQYCGTECVIEILGVEVDLLSLDCMCNTPLSNFGPDMAKLIVEIEIKILSQFNNTPPCSGNGNYAVRKPACWKRVPASPFNNFVDKLVPCENTPCCIRKYNVENYGDMTKPVKVTLLVPNPGPSVPTNCSEYGAGDCVDACRNMFDPVLPK